MKFENILRDAYGIAPVCVTPTKGGWSAEAYRVDTQAEKYFLKVYDPLRISVSPWIQRMEHYLPLSLWLQECTELGRHMPQLRLT